MVRRRGGSGRKPEPRIVDIEAHPRRAVCLAVAADYLGVSYRTVAARIDAGELAASRDGQRYLVAVAELKRYAAARVLGGVAP